MTEKPTPKGTKKIVNEDLTYLTCPIHNLQYPKGAGCPKCNKG